MNIIMIAIGLFFFLIMSTSFIISVFEKEKTAGIRSFLLAFLLSFPFFTLGFLTFPGSNVISQIILIAIIIVTIILFIPDISKKEEEDNLNTNIDERDIMFSRNELIPGTDRFMDYYEKNPEKLESDNNFRKNPGLLSKHSIYYNKLSFTAAETSFEIVEHLEKITRGEISSEKVEVTPEQISTFIKNWVVKLGAKGCGITYLKDYHKYSRKGRGKNYGSGVVLDHKYAIAITVEMDKIMVASAPQSPIIMESAEQYGKVAVIATTIASYIRNLGYPAQAHIDGKYDVVCPLVARDCGLGEIGRMGLLMAPKLGPRVRIAVITTDIPLIVNDRKTDHSVSEFCRICKKCSDVCPSQAISFEDKENIDGVLRWQINSEKCYSFWTKAGTDCGRCVSVCPYSHPDNFFHNMIRFFIKYFPVFRRFALVMDDVLYGRIPKPRKLPKWVKE